MVVEAVGGFASTMFKQGQSGNPAGRRKGARHRALVALDAIGQAAATEIMARVIAEAKGGDMRAAELLLRRLWPERKGRPVAFNLPDMQTAADLPAAVVAVTQAVARGDLTPDEGAAIGAMLDAHRRAIETSEMDARLRAIEAKTGVSDEGD